MTWSTITTSIGGAAPGGSAYVTESGADIRVVVVQEMFPTPAKRFVRLRISRTQ